MIHRIAHEAKTDVAQRLLRCHCTNILARKSFGCISDSQEF